MPEYTDSDIQKIEAIKIILETRLNDTVESVYYSFLDLARLSPLLKNQMGVERAFLIIQENSDRNITFRIRKGRHPLPNLAGQAGVYPELSDPVPVGIEVYVSQWANLDEYFDLILKRLSPAMKESAVKAFRESITIKKLSADDDGLIRFDGRVVEMRGQLMTLCWQFMQRHKALITIDAIKEELIPAAKRNATPNSTIAKYVSELHAILKPLYGNEVIFNTKKDGWIFDPSRVN